MNLDYLANVPPETRYFSCEDCEVRWKDTGYRSNCWLCEKEIVLLTLNDL